MTIKRRHVIVRRGGLALFAFVLAGVVIFAPRPWRGGNSDLGSPLIGRLLAPALDAAALKDQRYEGSPKGSSPRLWLVCATGLALAVLSRSFFLLATPRARMRANDTIGSRPSRAPPSLVAI